MAIFVSPSVPLAIPSNLSLPAYVCQNFATYGSKISLVNGISGQKYSFLEVERLIANVGTGLTNLGVRYGDVIMLLLPNCPEYAILFLGIASIGAITTTANPVYGASEVNRQVVDSNTKFVVTLFSLADKIENKNLPVIYLDDGAPAGSLTVSWLFSADGSKHPNVKISQDDVCALPYSSGTTGLAKGVMLTHRNLIANVAQHVGGDSPRKQFMSDDVTLGLLPMFHIYSITAVTFISLRSGTTLVTMPRFDLGLLLQLASTYKISVAPLVPPIVLLLTKSPQVDKQKWPALRSVISGAAPLGAELEAAFKRKFPEATIGQGYGMTESSPTVTLSLVFQKGGGPACNGSAGVLLPNTEAMIVDTASGRPLSIDQRGELWVRGPQVMKGYLNNSQATSATVDSNGWLHTGDVAYVDSKGNFFVVDRVKELIKVKGFQVPPAELEAILLTHPQVADAAVIGKADEESGEVPVAFVVQSQGSGALSEAEVLDFVAKKVVSYKRLHSVRIVATIPKSLSGKILRKELKSRL